jgi:hypothetical protein
MVETEPNTTPVPQPTPSIMGHLRRPGATGQAQAEQQPSGADTPDENILADPTTADQSATPEEPSTPTTYVQDELDLGIPKLEAQRNNPNRLIGRFARGLDRISGLLHRAENIRTPRQFIGDTVESAKQRREEASKTAWYVGSAGIMGASVKRERVSTKRDKPTVPEAGDSIASTRNRLSADGDQARERSSERLAKGWNTAKKIGRIAALGTGLTLALPVIATVEGTKFVNRKSREVAEDIRTGVKNTYHQARFDAIDEKERGATTRANAIEKAWNERETALRSTQKLALIELSDKTLLRATEAADKARRSGNPRELAKATVLVARENSKLELLKAKHQVELTELASKRSGKVTPQRARAQSHASRATGHRNKMTTQANTTAAA